MDQVFFFLTDWATPRRQSHTSHGAAGAAGGMQHRSALVARQVNALWLLSIDSGQLQQFAWQLPRRTVGHSQWVWQTSTYRAGIPSTPLESSLRMQRTNWQLCPRVGWVGRATSGRQAGWQADCAANCAATFNWQLLARSATFPLSIYDDDRQTNRSRERVTERYREGLGVNLTSFLVLPNQYENANWTENKVEKLKWATGKKKLESELVSESSKSNFKLVVQINIIISIRLPDSQRL